MAKFLKQLKIVISYWKNLKDLDYIPLRNCIMRRDIQNLIFNKEKDYFENKLNNALVNRKSYGKP